MEPTIDRTTAHIKGKWTPKEDATLTNAVKKHGNNWSRVATMVPSRSNKQCSLRWKVLLDPRNGTTTRKLPAKWTPKEDAKLADAVKELGDNNWLDIATLIPGRTNLQCRRRWVCFVDPDLNESVWKAKEDGKLTAAVTKLGKNWVRVAELVPGRTRIQCAERWRVHMDPNIGLNKTGKWTVKEDTRLTEAVAEHGDNNWAVVGETVPGRTNSQCRKRWLYSLDPDINSGKWTFEEDAKLIGAIAECGDNNWTAVAALVPGRTNLHCRHRWNDSLDPDISKGKWTAKETAKLTASVKKHGNNWLAVATLVPGRTKQQCRKRWELCESKR
jgi:myb proto-oncogene protein